MKRQGMSGWLWLLVAGAFEIGMTTALKLEQQDSRFLWVFLVCAVAGECLAKAIKTIPLGLAAILDRHRRGRHGADRSSRSVTRWVPSGCCCSPGWWRR